MRKKLKAILIMLVILFSMASIPTYAEETVESQTEDLYVKIGHLDWLGDDYDNMYCGNIVDGGASVFLLTCKQRYQICLDTNVPADQIRYNTGDTSIATVDANGVITGLKYGETWIQAYSTDGVYSEYEYIRVISEGFKIDEPMKISTCHNSGTVSFLFKASSLEGIDISRSIDSCSFNDSVVAFDGFQYGADQRLVAFTYSFPDYAQFSHDYTFFPAFSWNDGYNTHLASATVTITRKDHISANEFTKSNGIDAANSELWCKECFTFCGNITITPISYLKRKNKLVVYGGTLTRTDAYGALLESRAITLKEGVDYTVDIATGKYRIIFTDQCPYYTGQINTGIDVLDRASIKSFRSSRKNTATVKFKKESMAQGYEIQLSQNRRFRKKVQAVKTKKTSYIFAGLKGGKTYYLRIRPYRKVGKKTIYGPWSWNHSTTVKKSGGGK